MQVKQMNDELIDYHIGTVRVKEEVKLKFKALCALQNVDVKTKVSELISEAVKKLKV